MPDHLFQDSSLAALYDLFAPPDSRADFAFYMPMVMAAESVLDVGCGTGALLHRAREAGHTGRLCGLDPARGMLEQARARTDIEWVLGDLSAASWEREFDFVVMTGHAFQALVDDDEIRTALTAVIPALKDGGSFGFETRNPAAREWERWHELYSGEVTDRSGAVVRSECRVETPVEGEIVRFSHTFSSPGWSQPEVSHSTLRFLDAGPLSKFLADAGLQIEAQYGDWDRSHLTHNSPEIITIARWEG